MSFFENSNKPGFKDKPLLNLPKLLDEDLSICLKQNLPLYNILGDHNYAQQPKYQLKTQLDLKQLKEQAQDREHWQLLIQQIVEGRQGEIR